MPGYELIGKLERNAVLKVFKEGGVLFAHAFEKMRKKFHIREFEKECQKYFKINHCLAVTSGTAALKILLKSMGVKRGDEVITQSFNFIASIEAILDVGAKPIIANVDNSLNMDIQEIKKLISKKTKVIIPVHMLGVAADLEGIKKIIGKKKIKILEDNCEAIGGKYKNKYLGTVCDAGVFSFDFGKMITTGEGGLILTKNNKLMKYCREYHDHGHENNKKFARGEDTRSIYGFNYRMTELQGAIGKVQLKRLNYILKNNKSRYMMMEKILKKNFELRFITKNTTPNYDTFIFFEKKKKKRNDILLKIKKNNFGTKNLPDAVKWHCSAYWDHALPSKQVKNSFKTKILLSTAIAIPINVKRSIKDYQKLANEILLVI